MKYANKNIFDEIYIRIFHLFLLFLSFADVKFPTVAQMATNQLSRMCETSIVHVFHQLTFSSFIYKNVSSQKK